MENISNKPTWMNDEFFTTVVKHHSSDVKAKLINFVIKPDLALGEHGGSSMFRGDINYSTSFQPNNVLSVVIKTEAIQGDHAESVNTLPLFEIEQEMYGGPLMDIKSLLESVGDFCNISPKVIYQAQKPHRVIVLEDLGVYGYAKITQPLENFEDTKMVFQRLAKFHAASYFLLNEKKADYSNFKLSIYHIEEPLIRYQFLTEPIIIFMEVLESWGGYEDYIKKLKTFCESFIEKGKQLYTPDINGYNVLNHADFHIKNLLFKTNEDKIEDLYMYDFQISILASPCVDLFYALYNAISDENRRTRRDEIICYYHSEFSKALKHFGYIGKIPSLLDLNLALMKHGAVEVVKCICFKIFFFANTDEIFGTSDSKEIKRKIFNNPRYKEFILSELPRLVHLGFL
ncbi:CLUMA_CG014513, isoform A [Clunio marinus]|uniref:CLUMA_CG014513, isoform A n=1 Tax=Clunio marinus TaxID=568069 RepID=A0A1J1IMF9_9DIPT|nr:CLUMA_CG014513, isoform A [Clunio marinus]